MEFKGLRVKKLIKPRLQLKLIGSFLLLAGISALVQALVLTRGLGMLAGKAGEAEAQLLSQAEGIVTSQLALSFAIVVPLFLLIGVFVTFRLAGPVYRFEQYFQQIADGEDPGPCQLRKNDELQELCDLVNRALERRPAPLSVVSSADSESWDSVSVDDVPAVSRDGRSSSIEAHTS